MKFLAMAAACLLWLAGTSYAQSPSTQSRSNAQTQTISGCLSKTGNTYVITGGSPGPKQYRIHGGNIEALEGKLGHTVSVTGPVWESSPQRQMEQPYHAGSTTGVTYGMIAADHVHDVGANCSFTGSTTQPPQR